MLSIRDINSLAGRGIPVIARYELDGREQQGRILRARSRQGVIEVQCLNTGRWARLRTEEVHCVWTTK
jgi:hypothetical protein